MAVLLKWSDISLLVINVYLPPGKKKAVVKSIWAELEGYMTSVSLDFPQAKILLMGDFNARMGSNDLALENKFGITINDPEDDLRCFPQPRKFKDQGSNYAGLCLAKLTLKQSLHILNGSAFPDYPGEFTKWLVLDLAP